MTKKRTDCSRLECESGNKERIANCVRCHESGPAEEDCKGRSRERTVRQIRGGVQRMKKAIVLIIALLLILAFPVPGTI